MPATSVVDIHKKNRVTPPYDVYIGRYVQFTPYRETKWGNRFYKNLDLYEAYVRENLWEDLEELRGQRLGCWCITTDQLTPVVCHGQILMKLVREKPELKK